MNIKIFKMNEFDWVAAENIEDAKKPIIEMCGEEEALEEIAGYGGGYELSDEALDKLTLRDEDGTELVTFRDKLKQLIESGATFPRVFCSTEY